MYKTSNYIYYMFPASNTRHLVTMSSNERSSEKFGYI